jgi:hypothetical protein
LNTVGSVGWCTYLLIFFPWFPIIISKAIETGIFLSIVSVKEEPLCVFQKKIKQEILTRPWRKFIGCTMWRRKFEICINRQCSSDRPNVRFGRTSTVRFGPNDRTFFCRTQNFFLYYILHFPKWPPLEFQYWVVKTWLIFKSPRTLPLISIPI